MNEHEVKMLLALAMAYDNRKLPGVATTGAWEEQANRNRWTFASAREAIHRHYAESTDFLMPAHVTNILNDVRRKIRAKLTEDVCPPKELADDPAAEIAWRRERIDSYIRAALDAWARGEELPDPAQRTELGEKDRPELSSMVGSIVARKAIPAAGAQHVPGADDDHRRKLDEARAAIDAKRPELDALREAAS